MSGGLAEAALDPKARSYLLRKAAAGARAAAPQARIVFAAGPVAQGGLAPRDVKQLFSEENAAYVDFVGVTPFARPAPGEVRVAVDDMSFGKPALVDLDLSDVRSPGALLAAAARLAPENVPFVVASPAWPPAEDAALERFARLLDGDFGPDSRAAAASAASGEALDMLPLRRANGSRRRRPDPGDVARGSVSSGAFSLTLDETAYASAEVFELETGASKKFEIPASAVPARLSLSLANGPLGVRLVAREKLPSEAAKAAVGVAVTRGLTADEILAKHQAWRAARDARWKTLTARNTMSMRFRFAELANTFDLALAGPFFYEKGGSYDWAWSEAYFNGVRWKGKKIPELPLLQPEKVSDMPLALTFDDAYAYTLAGEDTVNGIPCWALDFTPRAAASDKPLYAGTVWVAKADFAAIRTRTRQLNLTAEIQAVDEVSDFGDVPAPDGGPPLRLPDAHDRAVDPQDVLADDGHRAREHALERAARPAGFRRRASGGLRLAGRHGARHGKGRALSREDEGRRARRHRGHEAHAPVRSRRRLLRQLVRLPAPSSRRLLRRPRLSQAARAAAGLFRRGPPRGLVQPAAPLRDGHRRRRSTSSASRSGDRTRCSWTGRRTRSSA